MALSGSTDFTVTRDDIIEGALRCINVISENDSATTNQKTTGAQALNMMVKAWQTKRNITLWKRQDIMVFPSTTKTYYDIGPSGDYAAVAPAETELAAAVSASGTSLTVDSITGISDADVIGIELDAGTIHWDTVNGSPSGTTVTITTGMASAAAIDNNVYAYTSLPAKPIYIDYARLRDDSDEDVPVNIRPYSEYLNLTDKDSTGDPNTIYCQPLRTQMRIYVWPIFNDVTDRLIVTARVLVDDFDASTNNADFPVEWFRALKFNLALELAPEYNKEPTRHLLYMAGESLDDVVCFDAEQTPIAIG